MLYNRLRHNPKLEMAPRTFFFAGKAAPAYQLAKLIIKFINNLAGTIDGDPAVRGRIKVVFLPEYNVSLAERLIPAADVSNQISTAGYEASGTSNMKFMMNGALTIGTRDGATIEMAEAAGEENFFLFGLDGGTSCRKPFVLQPALALRATSGNARGPRSDFIQSLQLLRAGRLRTDPRHVFEEGDYYLHLADLPAYLEADQQLVDEYTDEKTWTRKAILNVASSGKFSSDRTIGEYARGIWSTSPCRVD